ncbi:MAG: PLP-dependent aspartate aminotransferase family protein [Bacteroidales bacterium]
MKAKNVKSTRTPIYRDAGFLLGDISTMKKAFADEVGHPINPDLYIYSRYRNPTVVAAEEFYSEIESCKWSLLSQSGMAAIDIALSVFQKKDQPNKWAFFTEIYGGTNSFIDKVLVNRRGINATRFAPDGNSYSLEAFDKFMEINKPQVVFFEVISNPMLLVADAIEIIRVSKKHGAAVVIDNTFATPYLFKPLDFGADLVIHSATKYLAGHGNLSAGIVSGNDMKLAAEAIEYRKWAGHMISPDEAYRLHDMFKSFNIRVKQHFDSAFAIARFLESHPLVESVCYPGLESHPSHSFAKKLFGDKGFGGMVTFDIKGSSFEDKQHKCNKFIQTLSNDIPLVPTLGDADTILMPVEPVWGDRYPYPGMIRLSIGIEQDVDIIDKLAKGLASL